MNMFKKNGGFTLVELIIVIAILAILAGVAVPTYSGYITKANDAAVITELDAIKTACQGANAAKGEITSITVSTDGKTITVAAGAFADNFGTDFNTYYGTSGTWDATNKTITFTSAVVDFTSTSYAGKTATWSNGKWTAG